MLAQIACNDNALPQGSPCSPVLSNLIGHVLDIRLASLARNVGCNYSRYADDLTFSTSKLVFPVEIAQRIDGTEHKWQPGKELERIIVKSGFLINAGKTRMQYAGSRQDVTGLVVNAKVNTRAEYRRTARAMVHRLLKTGKFQMRQTSYDDKQNAVIIETDGSLDQLNGVLSFIDAVDTYSKTRRTKLPPRSDSVGIVYRRFLLYRNFYAAPAPTILCEGKTDNIYIKAAIRRLVDSYPRLAQRKAGGGVSFKVRLFRYTATTKRILGLGGGTGDLSAFIQQYTSACEKIEASGLQYPVILVVDNDDGAQSIYNAVKAVTKATGKADGSEAFYAASRNLYVVPTPLSGKGKSVIEDLFDANVKQTKLGGKSFNPSSKGFDRRTEYGKYLFAEQVVRKNQDSINFDGFRPLLERIDAAILAHGQQRTRGAAG